MTNLLGISDQYCLGNREYLTALIERRDYKEAVRFFESIEGEVRNVSGTDGGIIFRLGAKAYGSLGEFPRALPLIRTAINLLTQMIGESGELGECYMALGDILRNMGEYGEAEKAFRDAESIFRRNDDVSHSGDALNRVAGILFRKGDLDGSLKCLLEAVESAKKNDEKKKLSYLFGNIGRVYTLMGRLDSAEESIRFNIELSGELGDEFETTKARLSLGYLYIQQYRFDEAREILEQAKAPILKNDWHHEEAIYLTYLGELETKTGEYRAAETFLNEAVSIARKIEPDSLLEARPLRHLAELARLQLNYRKAIMLANQGIIMMKKLNDAIELGALQRILADCYDNADQSEKGREYYHQALIALEEHKAKFEMAETLAQMGQSGLYDSNRRMVYLCRAEDIYCGCHIRTRVSEMQKLIAAMDINLRPTGLDIKTESPSDWFPTRNARLAKIIGQLQHMKSTDLPILITGETGTGKDHLARYFHKIARPDGPYVAINCAAVPDNLIESELFGYHKGAFTGADANKNGLFLAANKGVLLLDEIGEMPLTVQAKLLNVIESRKLRPLGTSREYELDVIILAATNRDLYEMVKAGQFRLDLYYRLAGLTIELPPLRERKEDIPCLLELFMRDSGLLGSTERPESELVRQFVSYDWPGNIRQLENKVKQLAALSSMARDGSIIELSRSFFEERREEESDSLFAQVEKFEKRLLLEALVSSGGNKSEAARILAIHESTLRAKLKRYNLEAMVH
jgi:transcriptional regulator with PAS, ATPase and Fis domain